MNLKRNIRIATIAAISSAAISTPAMAFHSAGTIGTGPVKPHVAMSHADWKKCWTITYAQWRESGSSINNSATAADWTCGNPPL